MFIGSQRIFFNLFIYTGPEYEKLWNEKSICCKVNQQISYNTRNVKGLSNRHDRLPNKLSIQEKRLPNGRP